MRKIQKVFGNGDVRVLNDMIIHSTQAEWHQINDFHWIKVPEDTRIEFDKKQVASF